jgi:hypothetical protein
MVVGVEAPLLKRERSSFTRLVSSDGLAGLPFTTNPIKSPEIHGVDRYRLNCYFGKQHGCKTKAAEEGSTFHG